MYEVGSVEVKIIQILKRHKKQATKSNNNEKACFLSYFIFYSFNARKEIDLTIGRHPLQ